MEWFSSGIFLLVATKLIDPPVEWQLDKARHNTYCFGGLTIVIPLTALLSWF